MFLIQDRVVRTKVIEQYHDLVRECGPGMDIVEYVHETGETLVRQ